MFDTEQEREIPWDQEQWYTLGKQPNYNELLSEQPKHKDPTLCRQLVEMCIALKHTYKLCLKKTPATQLSQAAQKRSGKPLAAVELRDHLGTSASK